MSDRDELAASIAYALDTFFHVRANGPAPQDFVVADALLADGWRKAEAREYLDSARAPGHPQPMWEAMDCPEVDGWD